MNKYLIITNKTQQCPFKKKKSKLKTMLYFTLWNYYELITHKSYQKTIRYSTTVLRSPFVNKTSREYFAVAIYKHKWQHISIFYNYKLPIKNINGIYYIKNTNCLFIGV